jgi:hypothetical protein
MTTNALPAVGLAQIERSVERMIAGELDQERERFLDAVEARGVDIDTCVKLLSEFESWAAGFALPNYSAHVLAAYLIELRCCHGADCVELHDIARAFLTEHAWSISVPIFAALRYCENIPRSV